MRGEGKKRRRKGKDMLAERVREFCCVLFTTVRSVRCLGPLPSYLFLSVFRSSLYLSMFLSISNPPPVSSSICLIGPAGNYCFCCGWYCRCCQPFPMCVALQTARLIPPSLMLRWVRALQIYKHDSREIWDTHNFCFCPICHWKRPEAVLTAILNQFFLSFFQFIFLVVGLLSLKFTRVAQALWTSKCPWLLVT